MNRAPTSFRYIESHSFVAFFLHKKTSHLIFQSQKNVKFQFFGDKMKENYFIFIIGALKYWPSDSLKIPPKSNR